MWCFHVAAHGWTWQNVFWKNMLWIWIDIFKVHVNKFAQDTYHFVLLLSVWTTINPSQTCFWCVCRMKCVSVTGISSGSDGTASPLRLWRACCWKRFELVVFQWHPDHALVKYCSKYEGGTWWEENRAFNRIYCSQICKIGWSVISLLPPGDWSKTFVLFVWHSCFSAISKNTLESNLVK